MRANLCKAAVVAVCATALGGCFLFHERDAEGGAVDAGSFATTDAGPVRRDAGPTPRDAGPGIIDDDGTCRPASPVRACLPGQRLGLPAGERTSFTVSVDDCHCDGMPRCTVEAVRPPSGGGAGSIDVRVDICDESDCRACTGPLDARCDLPALDPGLYRVSERGFPLWELRAGAALISDPIVSLCQTAGSRGGGLCSFPGDDWAESPLATGTHRVCFPSVLPPGSLARVTVEGEVSCAAEPGPCDVISETTRGGSGSIEIRPRLRSCDEGAPTWDCGGSSGELVIDCSATVPDHEHERSVVYRGEIVGTIRVGGEAAPVDPTCVTVSP